MCLESLLLHQRMAKNAESQDTIDLSLIQHVSIIENRSQSHSIDNIGIE